MFVLLPGCVPIILSLLIMLFCSGCQSPKQKTAIKMPQRWPTALFSQNKKVDLAHLYWWKQFNNAELDAFMQKTLAQNSEAKIALARIEQAQSQLDQIKLSWLPGVNFLAGYTQFPSLGNPGAIAMAYPSYIVNLLQLYKQQKSAKALYEASVYSLDGIKVVLLARTAASYFVLLAQIEALKLHQNLLTDLRAYLGGLSTQYRSGLIAQDLLIEQESKLKFVRSQIQLVHYNITVSKNALHYLFDENPGDIAITTDFNQFNKNVFIPGNQPVSVLRNRPDVRQAEALLKAAHADTEAIQATFFPQINLGAYLGTSGNQGGIKLGQAYADGPLINLPVLAQIKGVKARYKEYYLHYRDTIKQALRDVANDMAAFSAYSAQLHHNTSAFKDARKQCGLVRSRYKHGLENSLAALQCAVTIDELAIKINQNKLEQMIALVSLYQDLGGGYDGN
jgi:outer membrane protein TolC